MNRPDPPESAGKGRVGSANSAARGDGGETETVAVALGNRTENPESVPRVLSTGRGEFAETILEIAFRNGVKVREDTDLAEILATVDLDSEIPVEAFVAVAEILRYVYANNSETSAYLERKARESARSAETEDSYGRQD